MTKKLRILCLHGSRTNADIMMMQTGGFQYAFGSKAEFVFVNSAKRASGPAQKEIRDFFGENETYYEWWEPFERNKTHYPGWDTSLAYIQDIVAKQGPFDIVLGFSQGATLATLMTAHYQAKGKEIPYKAVVLVCGGCPRDGMPEELLQEPGTMKYGLNIPSFHILGEQDDILDLGQELIETYTSKERHVHVHPGGHRFPSGPAARPVYKQFADLLKQICATS